MKQSKVLKNAVFGFGGQLVIIILGIIIPRIMIKNYGSDTNGLMSTVTQIFTYMALFEAGIGQAARNALYKPITQKNHNEISYVLSIAQRDFRKITGVYFLCVLCLSFLAPFLLKSNIQKSVIFGVILLEGLSGVISFYYIATVTAMLYADGRGYVINGINVINKVISYAVKIIMACMGINIVFLQLAYFFITIARVVFYHYYFKKNYAWINFHMVSREAKLEDRNSYVITEIAWTTFSSTDMIVLSMFVSTQLSSVYSVYSLIFTNLNVLLNAVYNSVSYILGQTYHEDIKKYAIIHDAYTTIFLGSMSILMAIAYVLCIPFIKLYTAGVCDINYVYKELPILFCLVQIFSWSRYVSGNLTGIAGYAKETSRISSIEAVTNVILSVVLVHKYGIVGVLLATVIALPLKIFWCIYVADKKVMKRSCKNTFSILGMNYVFFTLVVIFSRFLNLQINDFYSFLIYGVTISAILTIIGVGMNFTVNPSCLQLIKTYLKKEKKQH